MDLVSFSVGSLSIGLAELRTQSSGKKKAHVNSVYSHSLSFKKLKKPKTSNVVNLSVGLISLGDIGDTNVDVYNNVSGLSDVENMANIIAEETSYAESGKDDNIDKTMLKKTYTQTYMLSNLLKQPVFKHMSNDDKVLELLFHVVVRFNQLLTVRSHVLNRCNFEPVKFFVLDIELSAVLVDGFRKAFTPLKFPEIIRSLFIFKMSLKKAKEIAISGKILVNDDLRKVNSQSDQEVIIKEISVDLSKSAMESVFSKFGRIISIKIQLIAGLSLVYCTKYKQFGHISDTFIAYLVSFGDKTWVQIAGSFFSCVISSDSVGAGLSLGIKPISMVFNFFGNPYLVDYLASLEHFLKLLSDQVFVIIKKLTYVMVMSSAPSFLVIMDTITDFSLSNFKVLITKMSRLESKMVALEVSVKLVLNRLNCLCSDLDLSAFFTPQ
ncbi:hypothetical protein G9A89_012865 [Geosiphon pyriformis]|nr:hypothetical protein G9A89_012865 [Geosiphon pyriformis]